MGTDLERNNKEVERGTAYCWVATNDQGEPIDMDFAILFSPNDDPTNQKSWAKVTVRRDLQVETEYKYTIWASNKIEENRTACGIMDPIFLIN